MEEMPGPAETRAAIETAGKALQEDRQAMRDTTGMEVLAPWAARLIPAKPEDGNHD
jgi:hypothetical protein